MRYQDLPAVGTVDLPELVWQPTAAFSERAAGVKIEDVWLHRWGIASWRSESIDGVVAEFENVKSQASSHIVYAGQVGKDAGRCVQMVAFAKKAWTEAAFNSEGVSVECGDAIWLGGDPDGFAVAARMTGFLVLRFGLHDSWVKDPHTHQTGFTRHADGGQDAGGHTMCPTTDVELWGQFVSRVHAEIAHGGYRPLDSWGR